MINRKKWLLSGCQRQVGITVKLIRGKQNAPYLPFKNTKNRWEFLLPDGKVVIKPVFPKADVFSEGLAWLKKNNC